MKKIIYILLLAITISACERQSTSSRITPTGMQYTLPQVNPFYATTSNFPQSNSSLLYPSTSTTKEDKGFFGEIFSSNNLAKNVLIGGGAVVGGVVLFSLLKKAFTKKQPEPVMPTMMNMNPQQLNPGIMPIQQDINNDPYQKLKLISEQNKEKNIEKSNNSESAEQNSVPTPEKGSVTTTEKEEKKGIFRKFFEKGDKSKEEMEVLIYKNFCDYVADKVNQLPDHCFSENDKLVIENCKKTNNLVPPSPPVKKKIKPTKVTKDGEKIYNYKAGPKDKVFVISSDGKKVL